MDPFPPCPKCYSPYVYSDSTLFICPECSYEWPAIQGTSQESEKKITRDANGNELKDGDTVTIIKDLKVKGASSIVKVGTKVKNIHIVEGDHDIDCKIPGIGNMGLKSQFVKKVSD